MPIAFARASYIKRSLGHSTVQRLAYLLRARMVFDRTGQVFDFSSLGDLAATATLLPEGSAPVADPQSLWEAIEAASKRADATLGFELVLSLPTLGELDLDLSVTLTRSFVEKILVAPHSLAATYAVHKPHLNDDFRDDDEDNPPWLSQLSEEARKNVHAHILITPRQWTPWGPAKTRYTEMDPVTRDGVTIGRNWGRLWGLFQNEFFSQHAPELRVRQNPPLHVDTIPLAEARKRRRLAKRRAATSSSHLLPFNIERETNNSIKLTKIDGAMRCFENLFTRSELEQFHARHNPLEIAMELVDATVGLGDCVEVEARGGGRWLAGIIQVQEETSIFARALLLSERWARPSSVPPIPWAGFRQETQRAIKDILEAPDFVFLESLGNANRLLSDVARLSEQVGLVPVVVPTAAGHPLPKAIVRTFESLSGRPVTDALIVLDDVDSLTPSELSLAFAVAVAGGNKLVLVRRMRSDWPRLELLDLIRSHVHVLSWTGESEHEILPSLAQSPPRSAITLPLSRERGAFGPADDWPNFAVDMFGNVATSRPQIGRALSEVAAHVPELRWAKPRQHNDRDFQILTSKVARWVIEDPNAQEAKTDVAHFDHYLQEAAAEAWAAGESEDDANDDLAHDVDDDGFDPSDVKYDDTEPDWDHSDDFGQDSDV